MEGLGFWKKGTGGNKITELSTMFGNGGSLIVNTSGGLRQPAIRLEPLE